MGRPGPFRRDLLRCRRRVVSAAEHPWLPSSRPLAARKAAVRAVDLERINFDVVHHVTLAASWTRAGVTTVDKPVIWGPVGGGVETPLSCSRTLAGEAWSTRPAA